MKKMLFLILIVLCFLVLKIVADKFYNDGVVYMKMDDYSAAVQNFKIARLLGRIDNEVFLFMYSYKNSNIKDIEMAKYYANKMSKEKRDLILILYLKENIILPDDYNLMLLESNEEIN